MHIQEYAMYIRISTCEVMKSIYYPLPTLFFKESCSWFHFCTAMQTCRHLERLLAPVAVDGQGIYDAITPLIIKLRSQTPIGQTTLRLTL